MRRENAGCVTCRSWAERLKLRVSARLTKSSSHLVSMAADYVLSAWRRQPSDRRDDTAPREVALGVGEKPHERRLRRLRRPAGQMRCEDEVVDADELLRALRLALVHVQPGARDAA